MNATETTYIIVRQDTLDGLQADGTWGQRSTARQYASRDEAFDAASVASDAIDGRLVTVKEYLF